MIVLPLGKIIVSPAAIAATARAGITWDELIQRHAAGDWGDVDWKEKAYNDAATNTGRRVLSAYVLPNTSVEVWVITEHDRRFTQMLLPEEYEPDYKL